MGVKKLPFVRFMVFRVVSLEPFAYRKNRGEGEWPLQRCALRYQGESLMDRALQMIAHHAEEGARLRREFFSTYDEQIAAAARQMAVSVARGGKVLFAGNGGSAADAQHWAAEFVNRFIMDRPPLPAIALTTDSSILTSIGNDFGYDLVFAKQVQALGKSGDIFVGISTSGNSPNVVKALEIARNMGLFTVGLTGDGGGKMAPLCNILLAVPHSSTPLVQELHAAAGHMLCALTDYYLFENVMAIKPMLDRSDEQETNHADV